MQRPSITDYVGTILNRAENYHRIKHKDKRFEIKIYEVLGLPPWIILNRAEYYYQIKHKTKLFEIKTYEVLGLPQWIIFHPSTDLRNVGMAVNLVARLHGPIGAFKTAKSAWKYCGVEGADLGFGTRQELKPFMTRPRVRACVCMGAYARASARTCVLV